MSGNADFGAFDKYLSVDWDKDVAAMSISGTLPGKKTNFFLLDFSKYAKSPHQETIRRAFENHVAIINGASGNIDKFTGASRGNLVDDYFKQTAGKAQLQENGGGVALRGVGVALMDSRTSNLKSDIDDLFHTGFQKISPTDEKHYDTYVRHHEAAHLILGLNEAGADFVSAALTLRAHPDARHALEITADMRMIRGMKNGEADYSVYGVECHDAIKRVLAMSPEKLKAMSLKDMYEIGTQYDELNRKHSLSDNSPEKNVQRALTAPKGFEAFKKVLGDAWGKILHPNIGEAFVYGGDGIKIGQVVQGAGQLDFPEHSPENKIAGDLRRSVHHIQQHTAP